MFRLKKAVLKKSPDTKVVDIKIEKVFRKLFTQKGVKVTKAEVFLLPKHSAVTQQSTSSFMTVYLIFLTLSRQKAKGLSSL